MWNTTETPTVVGDHPPLVGREQAVALFQAGDDALDIRAECRVTGKTGVEMEALTAVSVAALTVYDMCKAVDRAMKIEQVRLRRKAGGKSGDVTLP